IARSMRDHLATTVVVVAVVVLAVSFRHLVPRRAAIYVELPIFSALWMLAFSVNGWVIMNLHEFRYFYPLYVTYMLFVAGAVTELVLTTRRWRPRLQGAGDRRHAIAVVQSAAVVLVAAVALSTVHRTDVTALSTTDEHVAAA